MTPWLMRCALRTIWLCAAWRNTSSSRITASRSEAIRSASTWPGPTEGSWSASPTSSRPASSGSAASSASISGTSTIDISSTTSRSQASSFSGPRRKPRPGSASSRRCRVLASRPVLSLRRRAARPVGAAEGDVHLLAEPGQDRLDERGLAGAGTARDDQELADQREAQGGALALGQAQAQLALHLGDPRIRLRDRPSRPATAESAQRLARSRPRPGRSPAGTGTRCRRPRPRSARAPLSRHRPRPRSASRRPREASPPARPARCAACRNAPGPTPPRAHGGARRAGGRANRAECRDAAASSSAEAKPMPRMSCARR